MIKEVATHVKESRILIWHVTMHCNIVYLYGILLFKHTNFDKFSTLIKSMSLIIMVGSDFLFGISKYYTRWSRFDIVRWKVYDWTLKVVSNTLSFRGMRNPSMVPDWSSNVYFCQILKDFKLMAEIFQNLIHWILMIKYYISKFWDIPDPSVIFDWSSDVCMMRIQRSIFDDE